MSALPQLSLVPRSPEQQWLSAEQVMTATGWSKRTFYRRSAELLSREKPGGLNARAMREYLASSLPAAASQAQLVVVPPQGAQLGPLFAGLPAVGAQRITLTDPAAQAQAEKREAIIKPLIYYADNAERLSQLKLPDGRAITSLARLIEHVALTQGACVRTIKQWLALYRAGGFVALADRKRADKGTSRWFARHRAASVLAAYLYLVERQSVTFVREQIEFEAESLGLVEGDLPSRETVRVFLADAISPAMKTLAREGQRAYRERMAPYLRRGFVDVFANQVWVGDHAIHDVEISNDIFTEVPRWTPGRLRMSAFVDYRSRKAWGTWAWEGSSRSIAATMLRAILEVGPPDHIYVDNGRDYRKIAKGATRGSEIELADDEKAPRKWWDGEYESIERTGLLARLGISVTHCIPRHPQSKHVERFFRTMHERFDAVHHTYTSGSPFTRPEATEAAMMRHRRLLKAGRGAQSNHPLASRFILGCLSWLEEYNNTPQSGEGMDGLTPNQVFEMERNPNQKPTPEPATLALLMSEFARRKVQECSVRVGNYRYTPRPDDRNAWAAMHEANECEVMVAYNSNDLEFVVALDREGRFIAWLEAEQLARFAPNDPETQKQIGESMEIRRGLEKATKQSLALIANTARANGAKSAEELLYSRLQIPTAAGEVVTQSKPRLRPEKKAQAPMTPAQVARMLLEE